MLVLFGFFLTLLPQGFSFLRRFATPRPLAQLSSTKHTLDFTALSVLTNELRAFLIPSKVENLVQHDRFSISMGLKTINDSSYWIHFSWHHFTAHMCLLSSVPAAGKDESLSLAKFLSSVLKNQILVSMEIPFDFERVVAFKFCEKLKQKSKYCLYLEILGTRSNLILVSSDGRILISAYQTSKASPRIVQINQLYSRPLTAKDKISPSSFEKNPAKYNFDCFSNLLLRSGKDYVYDAKTLQKQLVSVFQGLSNSCANLMISKCESVHGNENESMIKALYKEFMEWVSMLSNPSRQIHISIDNMRMYFDYTDEDIQEARKCSSKDDTGVEEGDILMNTLIHHYYFKREKSLLFHSYRAQCNKLLKRQLHRLMKLKSTFIERREMSSEEMANSVLMKADLVTSFLYRWNKGESSLWCKDFLTQEEKLIEIPKDSTAQDYADQLYEKGKKIRRSAEILDVLLERIQIHQTSLDEIEYSLMVMDDYISWEDTQVIKDNMNDLEESDQFLRSIYQSTRILEKDVAPKTKSKDIVAKNVKKVKKSRINEQKVVASGKRKLSKDFMVVNIKDTKVGNKLVPLIVGINFCFEFATSFPYFYR